MIGIVASVSLRSVKALMKQAEHKSLMHPREEAWVQR